MANLSDIITPSNVVAVAPGPAGDVLTSNGTAWISAPSPNPPPAPANVSATTSATAGVINVSWSASVNATGYVVYYGTTTPLTIANSSGSVSSATTSASITGLTGGTTYYMVVIATNGYGNSILSSQVSQIPNGVPTAGSITSATGTSSTTISVSWTAGGGKPTPTEHRLYYSTTSPVTTASSYITVTSSPASLTGLTGTTTYYLAVGAVNSYGTTLSAQTSAQTWPAGTVTYSAGQNFTYTTFTSPRYFYVAAGVSKIRVRCDGGGGGGGSGWNSAGAAGGTGGSATAEITLSNAATADASARLFIAHAGGAGLNTQSNPPYNQQYESGGQGGGASALVGYASQTIYVVGGGGGGGGSGWAGSAGAGGAGGTVINATGYGNGSAGANASTTVGGGGGSSTAGTNTQNAFANASGNLGGDAGRIASAAFGGANNSTFGAGGNSDTNYYGGGGGGGGGFRAGAGGWADSGGAGGGGGASYVNPTYCTAYTVSGGSAAGGTGGLAGYQNSYEGTGSSGSPGSIYVQFLA